MAGKMLIGDPKMAGAFKAQTGIALTEGERSLMVVGTNGL